MSILEQLEAHAMIDRIRKELEALPRGHTRVVFGCVVTRWDTDLYELDTWGRFDDSAETAAAIKTANEGGA